MAWVGAQQHLLLEENQHLLLEEMEGWEMNRRRNRESGIGKTN